MMCSSLHWLILGFLYAVFVQWSIFLTSKSNLSFEHSKWHFQTITLCSFVSYTYITLTGFSSYYWVWHSYLNKCLVVTNSNWYYTNKSVICPIFFSNKLPVKPWTFLLVYNNMRNSEFLLNLCFLNFITSERSQMMSGRELFIHGIAMVPYVQLSTNSGLDNLITIKILLLLY